MFDFKSFFTKNWKLIATHVLVAVISSAIVYKMFPQVTTHETIKEVEVTKEDSRVQELQTQVASLNEELDRVKTQNTNTHTEKTETKMPDGTVVTKETTDNNTNSTDTTKQTQVQVVTVEKEVVVTKEVIVNHTVEVEKLVTPAVKQWHLGVLVGVAPRFDSPAQTPLLVGVEAERRILGPVFAGAWVMAGSPVVGAFKVTNAAVGVKIGMEF